MLSLCTYQKFSLVTFYTRNCTKNLPIIENILNIRTKFFFGEKPLIKTEESTGSGFGSQHTLCFLFFAENCITIHSFQTSKPTPSYECFDGRPWPLLAVSYYAQLMRSHARECTCKPYWRLHAGFVYFCTLAEMLRKISHDALESFTLKDYQNLEHGTFLRFFQRMLLVKKTFH